MLQALWSSLWATLYFYLRPMLKWFFRKVTGKCELLRITYQYPKGYRRTKYVEESLQSSGNHELRRLVKEKDTNVEAAIVLVMKHKDIIPEIHLHFESTFRQCLVQINGYVRLHDTVETLRQEKYSKDNEAHEKKLLQLWSILTDGQQLESRTSSQWTQIGFQGNDPQTDFRGMGLLGLEQLLYFATKYNKQVRSMLTQSHNPKCGYSFAIVGINMTDLVYNLLKNGNLKTHFYNLKDAQPSIVDYHEVYCYVFHEFDKFWFGEKPRDIMDFGRLREKYRKKLISTLADKKTVLAEKFQTERVC